MAEADITRGTLEALARSPLDNAFLALRRVLTERAADAGGFLEDGSVGAPAPSRARRRPPVPDLVGEATAALMAPAGGRHARAALAFFRRRQPAGLRLAAGGGALPRAARLLRRAHGPVRRRSTEATSGTTSRSTPRASACPSRARATRRSRCTCAWRGRRRVPLVRWRTTIGSWRNELAADGQEYLRYKDSDVGPRVWRHVVAAPVWVPYRSSPLGGMVKEKWVNGALGPGDQLRRGRPRLPVGLRPGGRHPRRAAAARRRGRLLRQRHPHPRHLRLHLAARPLFARLSPAAEQPGGAAVLVRHPPPATPGAGPAWRWISGARFWWRGEVFDLRLPTRGFYFELDPPLPVETLPGTIKGQAAKADRRLRAQARRGVHAPRRPRPRRAGPRPRPVAAASGEGEP